MKQRVKWRCVFSHLSLAAGCFAICLFLWSGAIAPVSAYEVFDNDRLRFGTGSEASVNTNGNLQQPFYYDATLVGWYKLTYSTYPLDRAIGAGTGGTNWTGSTVSENPALSSHVLDTSGFIITSGSKGYGTIVSTGTVTVNGYLITLRNTYTLEQNKSFIKVVTRLTNPNASSIPNIHYWVGTRDDWVGTSDGPTKQRGNIVDGAFVKLTDASQPASALKIFSGQTGVLFYSTSPGVNMVIQSCCSFSNVYNQNPTTCAIEATNDGSYALYVPIGSLAPGAYAEFTWYYAAGQLADLDAIINDVAQASSATFTAINEDPVTNNGQTVASVFNNPIAVTVVDNTNGIWQYSADGSAWSNFSDTTGSSVNIATNARLLSTTYYIRFVPNANWYGSTSLTYRVWDGTTGTAGGTANASSGGGAFSTNTANGNLTVNAVNDPPTLSATASNPNFIEGGGQVGLFSSAAINTFESGQNVLELIFTVTNVNDAGQERIVVDGTSVVLTNGANGATSANNFSFNVSLSGTTAMVTLSKNDTVANWQTLINGLAYNNTSTTPDSTNRVVTLISIKDSGGTANGGIDVNSFTIASTVTITPVYTVTTTATNGTITSTINPTVNHGSTTTATGSANANYYFAGVSGCGGTPQSNTDQSTTTFSYTTGTITSDCTVTATFAIKTYTVSASAGSNGSLDGTTTSPQTVNHGGTTSFKFNADTGYHIASVSGCSGTTYNNTSNAVTTYTYTTGSITSDCTVTATFAINQYTVTGSAGSNGSLDATTTSPQTVNHGGTTSFKFNADTGYHIASVSGCSGTTYNNTSNAVTTYTYTTGSITSDCTVSATFAVNQYTATGSAGSNGSLDGTTPSPVTVNHGSTTSFKFNADTNYHVASVSGCGGTAYNNTSNAVTTYTYTTGAITSDCTVSATFAINQYTITAGANGSGSGSMLSVPAGINYNYHASNTGNALFDYGANVTLTITADAGSMAKWGGSCIAAGGTEAGNGTGTATCSFTSLSEAKNVTGTFSLLTDDDDGDGVINSVEAGAPNGGDGNNDGIQDSIQADIASLPSATGQGYLTLAVSGGCSQLQNVQAYTEGQIAEQDPGYDYEYGLVEFMLPCENATVAITYHNATDLTGLIYKKYGPLTPGDNLTIQWYDFPDAVITGNVITLTLADNAIGDDTGDDGKIYDQGGPTEIIKYTVTGLAGANGSLDETTPSPVTVDHGSTTSFKFNADTNYHVASVSGCGGTPYNNTSNAVATYTYTTGAITSDCTVTATFAINQYTITAGANGSGSGSVSSNPAGIIYNYHASNTGNALFDYGANVTLTITADAGSMAKWGGSCIAAGGTEAGNGTGTATCSFTSLSEAKNVTGTFSLLTDDDDGDGVINSVEAGAPNGGDGNNDGIQDSIQADIASLPSATGQGYLTLAVSGGCGELQNVQAYTEAQMAAQDYNHDYLYGLVSFVLPCENATVAITYHNATDLTGLIYKKYGPTTPGDNSTIQWYNFPNAVITGNVITLTLADNVLGDDTGNDGIIYDQGGPTDPHPIPTMTEWGMIIFMLLAGLGAIYSIRKQRKV